MVEVRRPESILIDPAFPGGSATTDLTQAEAEELLALVRQMAVLMDGQFVVPGTDVKFGLDALIGLIPGLGDAISAAISGYIILLARRCGVSRWTTGRMIANALVDMGIGTIPVAGDLFDVAWRANLKNVALLEKHLLKKFPNLRIQ